MTFDPVDMTELMNDGVLMAANERFFWPLGLALTWNFDKATGVASGLHVREWSQDYGTRECIDLAPDDEVGHDRRRRFAAWLTERIDSMAPSDRGRAAALAATDSA